MYELLANIVMVIHAGIMVGIVVGMGVCVRVKRYRPIQAGILLSLAVIWYAWGNCPLTDIENYLRLQTAHPIPLSQIGFIPYYTQHWFGFTVADNPIKILVYTSTAILCGLVFKERYYRQKRR
jgi:hypothetical protein